MTEARAIHSFAMGDVKRMPGMVYFFLVDCRDEAKKHRVDEAITSRLENAVFMDPRNKRFSQYAAVFRNASEAEETHRWIKTIDGAEDTKMYIMREIITVPDWADKEIEKHLNGSG